MALLALAPASGYVARAPLSARPRRTQRVAHVTPTTAWLYMCGTNAGSQLMLVNGVDSGIASGGTGGASKARIGDRPAAAQALIDAGREVRTR